MKLKEEGYEIEHDGKLITVFSAPNYCDKVTDSANVSPLCNLCLPVIHWETFGITIQKSCFGCRTRMVLLICIAFSTNG